MGKVLVPIFQSKHLLHYKMFDFIIKFVCPTNIMPGCSFHVLLILTKPPFDRRIGEGDVRLVVIYIVSIIIIQMA